MTIKLNIVFIFALVTFSVSCTSESPSKNKVTLPLRGNISTMDPAVAYDNVSALVICQVHEQLFEYEYLKRPFQLKPLLAESMPDISNDGLRYTIKIRKGIKYQPHPALAKNRTLKVQDFITQLKRIAYKPTQSTGWWLYKDKILGLNDFRENVRNLDEMLTTPVEGLKAIDDYTLVITLTRQSPQLTYALNIPFASPVPEELVRASNNDLTNIAVGTGPFLLKKWTKDESVEMEKFADYHQEKYPLYGDRYTHENDLLNDKGKIIPFLEQLNFKIITEDSKRWDAFINRKTEFIILTKDLFAKALDSNGKVRKELADNGIRLQIAPNLTYWWLAFNMQDPIVGKNLKLRQAIAHAVDIEKYIAVFTNNIALKANSIVPPGVPGYNASTILPYKYDIKKSKELIKKSGINPSHLKLTFDLRGNGEVAKDMGNFIKDQLAQIGISVTVVPNSFPEFLQKARTGKLQMWQGGWSMDYPDAENSIQLLTTQNFPPGPNHTAFSDKKMDQIYQLLSTSSDRFERLEAIKQAQEIVNRELPWIMQFYSRNHVLYHNRVKNFRHSDVIFNYPKYLKIVP